MGTYLRFDDCLILRRAQTRENGVESLHEPLAFHFIWIQQETDFGVRHKSALYAI